jgi:hypothetical protein
MVMITQDRETKADMAEQGRGYALPIAVGGEFAEEGVILAV